MVAEPPSPPAAEVQKILDDLRNPESFSLGMFKQTMKERAA